MLDDLETCLERLDEPKLSFDQVNNDPTIIATDSQFFTKTAPLDLEETKTEIEEIEPEEEKIKEPMDKKRIAIGVAIGAVIVCLAIVAGFFLFSGNQDGTMMDLVGKTEKEAILLIDKGYKVSDDVDYELSDKYEKGLVIATDPEAGHTINEGDTVTFTISKGKYIVMKDYTGISYNSAYNELTKSLAIRLESMKSHDDYKEGVVIGQSISEGEKQDPNEKGKIIT